MAKPKYLYDIPEGRTIIISRTQGRFGTYTITLKHNSKTIGALKNLHAMDIEWMRRYFAENDITKAMPPPPASPSSPSLMDHN